MQTFGHAFADFIDDDALGRRQLDQLQGAKAVAEVFADRALDDKNTLVAHLGDLHVILFSRPAALILGVLNEHLERVGRIESDMLAILTGIDQGDAVMLRQVIAQALLHGVEGFDEFLFPLGGISASESHCEERESVTSDVEAWLSFALLIDV